MTSRMHPYAPYTYLDIIVLVSTLDTFHKLIIAILGIRADDHVILAGRTFHMELPYFGRKVLAGLDFLGIETDTFPNVPLTFETPTIVRQFKTNNALLQVLIVALGTREFLQRALLRVPFGRLIIAIGLRGSERGHGDDDEDNNNNDEWRKLP